MDGEGRPWYARIKKGGGQDVEVELKLEPGRLEPKVIILAG